ncbi:Pre-B-cell leukemia transcription factor 2 [Fukomys damarensis]|uniref:Pre-B-cell leukemia transcription factor 2 n=1 Tax=Fukomys damarensis TaxID=885580 RepID=A0A091D7D7_FUKDA|nr:Pre-B-cell leukemia transcription factor 2 [Fukomys damarensis]
MKPALFSSPCEIQEKTPQHSKLAREGAGGPPADALGQLASGRGCGWAPRRVSVEPSGYRSAQIRHTCARSGGRSGRHAVHGPRCEPAAAGEPHGRRPPPEGQRRPDAAPQSPCDDAVRLLRSRFLDAGRKRRNLSKAGRRGPGGSGLLAAVSPLRQGSRTAGVLHRKVSAVQMQLRRVPATTQSGSCDPASWMPGESAATSAKQVAEVLEDQVCSRLSSPTPREEAEREPAEKGGTTVSQVSDWFGNKQVRCKKKYWKVPRGGERLRRQDRRDSHQGPQPHQLPDTPFLGGRLRRPWQALRREIRILLPRQSHSDTPGGQAAAGLTSGDAGCAGLGS